LRQRSTLASTTVSSGAEPSNVSRKSRRNASAPHGAAAAIVAVVVDGADATVVTTTVVTGAPCFEPPQPTEATANPAASNTNTKRRVTPASMDPFVARTQLEPGFALALLLATVVWFE
jgi:hypothetical protein